MSQQQAENTAMMDVDDGSGTREKLAAAGQQQTQQLLATAYQLLEACGTSGSAEASGEAGTSRQQELQERYLAVAAALRATLAECRALETREASEAAAAAAAAGAGEAASTATAAGGAESPEQRQLRARVAELRARLEERNALVKAAIDRLRHLLDALAMWDASKRELSAAAAATG